MSDGGWRQRRRDGQARAQAANLERRLEGPGAEQRLHRIRSRFRKALAGGGPGSMGLTTLSVLVFLAVVAIGLWLTR